MRVEAHQVFCYMLSFTCMYYVMARTHTIIPVAMLEDWYSFSDAAVYSRLRNLAYHTNECDVLYPSIEQIIKDTKVSKSQVIRSLKTLERTWLIEVEHRWANKRNNYTITSLHNYPCLVWWVPY